jgi:hypothetical protein
MMKRLLALSLLLAATYASAAPFIVSDPLDPRVTHCNWQFNDEPNVETLVASHGADKICKIDLAGRPVGTYVVNAVAVADIPGWGRYGSAPSENFTLVVPGQPVAPSGLRIVP